MAGHIERKEVIYMLILVGFVLGVFYFYKGQYFLNDMFRGQKAYQTTPQIIGNKTAATQAFRKKMEASLNDMLKGVFDEMADYRKRRKILSKSIDFLMKQVVKPGIEKQMDKKKAEKEAAKQEEGGN